MGPKGRKDKKSDIPTGFDNLHDKYGEYIFLELTDRLYDELYDGKSDGFSDSLFACYFQFVKIFH